MISFYTCVRNNCELPLTVNNNVRPRHQRQIKQLKEITLATVQPLWYIFLMLVRASKISQSIASSKFVNQSISRIMIMISQLAW